MKITPAQLAERLREAGLEGDVIARVMVAVTGVSFCSWCPDPDRPDPRFHSNGAAHQEAGK